MKVTEGVKRVGGMTLGIAVLVIFQLLAYWLTNLIYEFINWTPHDFIRQLLTAFLGVMLFGSSMYVFSKIMKVDNRHDKLLYPLIQAMKRMANGDFSIDLSHYRVMFGGRDHPYIKMIEGMDYLADKLGQTEKMRQEFISNVSHEIQSPLTSISGFAHALKNDKITTEERKHYLEIIETECSRLSKLSDNLLKLTALESEVTSCEPKTYRLDHQLRRIILANEPQWTKKELEMDVSLSPLVITADEDLLDQVWINLLHNAIKFTPQKGTIKIDAFYGENEIIVKLVDTGIGMTPEASLHLFERFYKADQSRNRSEGGNGLGMSIVKKIVSLHQGTIEVQSELGEGTEITVSLPRIGDG